MRKELGSEPHSRVTDSAAAAALARGAPAAAAARDRAAALQLARDEPPTPGRLLTITSQRLVGLVWERPSNATTTKSVLPLFEFVAVVLSIHHKASA